ncbi:MAG: branched-chain amino acid aminotransferase [Pseudomonadota bacterium]
MNIAVSTQSPVSAKPLGKNLGFGTHATDHLFVVNYSDERGWYAPRVEPYGPIDVDPRALAIHYGSAIFEGLKIYRQPDGGLALFRPDYNANRLNTSAALVALPELPTDIFLDGLIAVVRKDAAWAPQDTDYTLYARPVMMATEPILGVQRPKECVFYIILTPTPPYYREDQPGFKLLADKKLSRGSTYSVAASKTAGNYAKMIVPMEDARKRGFDNILWLGGEGQNLIEEAGITNVFVVYDDHIATPPLDGQILPGATRDSAITLLRGQDKTVVEKEISIEDLCRDIRQGRVTEVFLTGTATVVAPVASITYEDEAVDLGPDSPVAKRLYQTLTGIQGGTLPDPYGWLHHV